jgi:hypothetical protein
MVSVAPAQVSRDATTTTNVSSIRAVALAPGRWTPTVSHGAHRPSPLDRGDLDNDRRRRDYGGGRGRRPRATDQGQAVPRRKAM